MLAATLELRIWKFLLLFLMGGAVLLWYLDIWNGVFHLSVNEYVLIILSLTHITIASVTIFLHRHQAHRSLELHPIPSHFFRLWLWLTTGMITKEWTAIHRKHHATCETDKDPHSPKRFGLFRVLFGGVFLYVDESRNKETMVKHGFGTPDDWIERHVYTPYHKYGVILMLLIDLALFGPLVGVFAMWLVQMAWIPFFAAGVINGVGHYVGYRNFPSMNKKEQCEDWSTNIFPIGILIGGEELHNNHHYYPKSAKLSVKWFEFDVGWLYIRILEQLGLARVKYVYDKSVSL
ncbi:MAG: hypothetical protein A2494_03210 [Candidatus Lloydbacteria bacterium RIFOXYC12_FULL_46_25]|uniref:Fatty acid desaturase domain-containing protein n=1 Tax=Candidatus Lloydbacteria bacterium RIFOXYC12_FULL_46_25 TaxID=1798670 RepID=A0A1G2DUI4_9BACT|nr:MAG: hypothetical protein A2494_03210 [Candidatus Lloydbacteria bacterium RIFOXYC12_FULL_46_25]